VPPFRYLHAFGFEDVLRNTRGFTRCALVHPHAVVPRAPRSQSRSDGRSAGTRAAIMLIRHGAAEHHMLRDTSDIVVVATVGGVKVPAQKRPARSESHAEAMSMGGLHAMQRHGEERATGERGDGRGEGGQSSHRRARTLHARTHTHTCTHTHARAHTHTHMHTRARIQTYVHTHMRRNRMGGEGREGRASHTGRYRHSHETTHRAEPTPHAPTKARGHAARKQTTYHTHVS
jgi:hypothetical protein